MTNTLFACFPDADELTALVGIPHGHYKTIAMVAGLRLSDLVAQKAFDKPMNAATFEGMGGKMSRTHALERRHRHHGQSVEP